MKLTYDILLRVISSSWYAKDAVQLMATCQFLYREGPKIALKKAVFISKEEQLASFLKFLRADDSSCCQYLKQFISKSTSSWAASDDPEHLKRQSQDPQVVRLLAV